MAEIVVYEIIAKVRSDSDTSRAWRLVQADRVVTCWKNLGAINAVVNDRSAAKDLAWQLLVHPDVANVTVTDSLYDPDNPPWLRPSDT